MANRPPATATSVTPAAAPAAGRTTGRRLLAREERRSSLLRAAAVAFARTGFQATSMDDVAAEAGVTRLIVYRHFESKEELYRAVLETVSADLVQALADRAAQAPDAVGGTVIGTMLRVARMHPDAFRILWLHAPREPAFADYAAEFHVGAVAFADLLAPAHAPAAGPLRTWSTEFMVSAAVEAVLGWLDHGDPSLDDEFAATATDGFRAMILAWGPAEPTGGAPSATAAAGAAPPRRGR